MVSIVGGTAPYTYSWMFSSGDSGITPLNPTSNTTKFTAIVPCSTNYGAYYYLKVTDSLGKHGNSGLVTIQLTNVGGC